MAEGHINHIEIYVSNLEQSRQFWEWLLRNLQYKLYQEWSEGFSFINHPTYIVFVQTKERFLKPSFHRCRTGLNHLAFEINSKKLFNELMNDCAESQIPILYQENSELNFDRSNTLFIEDPDRIKVEIKLIEEYSKIDSLSVSFTIEQSFALSDVVTSLKSYQPSLLKDHVQDCLLKSVHPNCLYEAILQSYLFYGFPSALEGIRVLYEVIQEQKCDLKFDEDIPHEKWKYRGEKICEIVYKHHYPKLINHLSQMSPELTNWMIVDGYGKVLGRRVLPLDIREFLNVAMLSYTSFIRQLHSHLHGANNAGFPIAWLSIWFDERKESFSKAIWDTWEKFSHQVHCY